MCLAATQKGIIISANLLAALLLIQPSMWLALVAARVPCWPLFRLSAWIPSSFLLVTPVGTGTATRICICLCWILRDSCQASLPVCPDTGEWQPYASPFHASPSSVSSTNGMRTCPSHRPGEAVLTLVLTQEGHHLKSSASWIIWPEWLTYGPEPLDHNHCIWSLVTQLVFHPASKNDHVFSFLAQSLCFRLLESWTVEQKLFVL